MGKGWVQELVSRLTYTPLEIFDSSTNSTLDGDSITFPLNQPIYVDATHDAIIAASESYYIHHLSCSTDRLQSLAP